MVIVMERTIPKLEGVEHSYVEVGELRMHVASAGDPDADPVVLLHGWPQHWYAWRKLIGPLAEQYRVIAPDLRGFGWTDAPRGSYLKSVLAADVVALLDVLGLERVRLAGHDWGGFAGFLVCIEAPERVSHYAAAGMIHPWVRAEGGIGERLGQLMRVAYQFVIASPVLGGTVVRRVPAFTRLVLEKGARRAAWAGDEIETFVEQWAEPDRAAATVAVYRSFLTKELPAMAKGSYRKDGMETPAVLLVGEHDPVVRANRLGGYERLAPNLRIETVAGTGHWIPEEAPEEMLEQMLALYRS